ncbi:YqeG family HAD IIIA-type phosphatase [Candidatus Saccharibacteria bacterium]|nr:YqeG family HAD IIIA-type phosphatase [Candidatus Saccharibacteria bacterium]
MSILHADRKFDRFEDVTPEILKAEDVKLLLCDLDNTLTARLSSDPVEGLEEWVKSLKKAGVELVIISNNIFKKRVQSFSEPYGVRCVWWAKKPMSTHLTKVREEAGVPKKNTAMLGDKWSTDVLAAKFAGIRAWKVEHRKSYIKEQEKQD